MQLRARVLQIPARRRLVLSGTPVQNNLAELHALVDLTNPGLLGDAKEFREAFAKPIAAGLHRAAAPGEARRGADAAAALRAALAPVVLRREKADVFPEAAAPGGGARPDPASSAPGSALDESPPLDAAAAAAAGATGPAALAPKVDLVVWLRLRPAQLALYRAFLASPSVRAALNRSASPLAAITVLKKVCDHPALLGEAGREGVAAGAAAAARRAGREGCGFGSGGGAADVDADADAAAVAAAAAAEPEAAALLAALRAPGAAADAATSCKTAAALALLARLVAEGHRTLVFSPSTRVLDVLEAAAAAAGWAPARVDGGVASAGERAARVAAFQEPGSPSRVFLLTTQVGGVGLTLTAASRCIILSPSWNPAADDQAAGRAHRLGQTQEVVVYRFVTAGTVEDKVYRTQVGGYRSPER
jgi:SNF2 family DNA or RNA helicase